MIKTFKFNTESQGKYEMKVSEVKGSFENFQFDVVIKPPKGHSIVLRNVKYTKEVGFYIPRGSGFEIKVTKRLRNRLNKIAEELSKELKNKKAKTKSTTNTKNKIKQSLNTTKVKDAREYRKVKK